MSLVKTKKRTGELFPKTFGNLFNMPSLLERPDFLNFNGSLLNTRLQESIPSVNIKETNKDFKIEVAAPGLEKKDFKVESVNGTLKISAEKEKKNSEEKENYWRKEFSYKNFERIFQIPKNSIPEKIEAKYENGLLKITLPKKEVTTSKTKMEITVS